MEKLTVNFPSYLSRDWYRSCGDKYLGILNFDSRWNDSATRIKYWNIRKEKLSKWNYFASARIRILIIHFVTNYFNN
jgi:hypothetical protein